MLRQPLTLILTFVAYLHICAEEPSSRPKEVPATRPLLKQALERVKTQEPRLPLPPPTAEERQPPAETTGDLSGEILNSARLRNRYLHADLMGSRGNKDPRQQKRAKDPNMTLDSAFCLEMVWIASRANNCHYCLGHQEVKLRALGEPETRIGALDCDWSRFSPAEQAAYTLARKLTLRPDRLTDDDFKAVLMHYKPLQVLEMVSLIARYNMANRWNSSLGIPQEEYRVLLTETPVEFVATKSIVAPERMEDRPALDSREATLRMLESARSREPRLPLVDASTAREVIGSESSDPVPNWIRLLANFPVEGKGQIESYRLSVEKGLLSHELKAQIAWTAAREDRAWYALDQAMRRLQALGYTQERIFALDKFMEKPSDGTGLALAFARKLTTTPQAIADADIAALRKHFTDPEVAEIVYHVTRAAYFNRVTEAAALPLDNLAR